MVAVGTSDRQAVGPLAGHGVLHAVGAIAAIRYAYGLCIQAPDARLESVPASPKEIPVLIAGLMKQANPGQSRKAEEATRVGPFSADMAYSAHCALRFDRCIHDFYSRVRYMVQTLSLLSLILLLPE